MGGGEVASVNGKTGAVVLNASDVEAISTTEKGADSGVVTLSAGGKVPSSQLETRRDFTFTCSVTGQTIESGSVVGTLAITPAQVKDCFNKSIEIHSVGTIDCDIYIQLDDITTISGEVLLSDIVFTPYLYVDEFEDEHWKLISTPFIVIDTYPSAHQYILTTDYNIDGSSCYIFIREYRGPKGEQGEPGGQGFSPYITVTDHGNYHEVEIMNETGTTSFDIYNGEDGIPGLIPISLQIDLSTFDITGVQYDGEPVTFLALISGLNEDGVVTLPTLYFKLNGALGCWTLENILALDSATNPTGKIIFRCNSVNKSGLIDEINQLIPNKFPSNTTDLDIIWSREYDSDNDTYIESLTWSPITDGVTTIDMSTTSAQTFQAALGGFIQAATSTPNVPTIYIYTGGTLDEFQDVMNALNAGKTVWLNNNGMKQSIVNYASNGFTVHVYLPQFDIGQGVNIMASIDSFVTNNSMILYGYFQTI